MRMGSDHVCCGGGHSCFFIMTHIDSVPQNVQLVCSELLICRLHQFGLGYIKNGVR